MFATAAGDPADATRDPNARGGSVAVLRGREAAGEWWFEIGLYGAPPCEAAVAPSIVATGWVPLYGAADDVQLWFHARGC